METVNNSSKVKVGDLKTSICSNETFCFVKSFRPESSRDFPLGFCAVWSILYACLRIDKTAAVKNRGGNCVLRLCVQIQQRGGGDINTDEKDDAKMQ